MIWDTCLAGAVARELEASLAGARARAFSLDRDAQRVTVWFRDATWRVELSGTAGWTVLEEGADPPDGAEPLPATLVSVESLPDERILIARFRRVRGRKAHPSMIFELATNRWNAIWAEGDDLKVVKRLRVDARRPHTIGQPWSAPAGEARMGVDGHLEAGVWASLVDGSGGPDARRALLRSVAFVSSINAGALAEADPDTGEALWRRMARLESLEPGMLQLDTGPQPYPWPLPGPGFDPAPTLLAAMERLAAQGDQAPAGDAWARDHLNRQVQRLTRRRSAVAKELERAGNASRLREKAQLILASLHLIPSGADRVSVPGLDGRPTELVLDPRQRPQDEADALFTEAARMERAVRALPAELAGLDGSLERTRDQLARSGVGGLEEEELASLRREVDQGVGKPRGAGPPPDPYHRFRSSGGLEIRVGRNSKRNDELTFHHARPDDVWLHARHAAGAHVVLRWTSADRPPARDLEEAAVLAALHSRARGSGQVPVDWTRRKYVRKPRGAKPGSVRVERAETLFVTPDPSLPARLAEE